MRVVNGIPTLTWSVLPVIIDPFVGIDGQMMCRLDLAMIKQTDPPMPLVAGRAPDRMGTMYYDSIINPATPGVPYVLAGDRVTTVAGPIFGVFEIRTIPTAAVDLAGPHHIEVQIFEVAQSIAAGSPTPFPGSEGPET